MLFTRDVEVEEPEGVTAARGIMNMLIIVIPFWVLVGSIVAIVL